MTKFQFPGADPKYVIEQTSEADLQKLLAPDSEITAYYQAFWSYKPGQLLQKNQHLEDAGSPDLVVAVSEKLGRWAQFEGVRFNSDQAEPLALFLQDYRWIPTIGEIQDILKDSGVEFTADALSLSGRLFEPIVDIDSAYRVTRAIRAVKLEQRSDLAGILRS